VWRPGAAPCGRQDADDDGRSGRQRCHRHRPGDWLLLRAANRFLGPMRSGPVCVALLIVRDEPMARVRVHNTSRGTHGVAVGDDYVRRS